MNREKKKSIRALKRSNDYIHITNYGKRHAKEEEEQEEREEEEKKKDEPEDKEVAITDKYNGNIKAHITYIRRIQ